MRNWKFLLTSQIARGYWFLNIDHALAAGSDLELLFSPGQNLERLTDDPLLTRGSLPILAAGPNQEEGSVFDQMPEGSIAVFKISGTLLKYGTMCTYGTEEIADVMMQAAAHKNIAGALLEVDSGGGAVNAVSPMVEGIRAFKNLGKPILALADAAYSAAYWSVTECNYIMASNTISSGFGSIGVMMSFMDMKGLYEKEGRKLHTIYAPESTEKNLAFELALEGKYDMIKAEELSPLAVAFQNTVKANRGTRLKLSEDDKILKGKNYSATKALDLGLIDGIGNRSKALDKLFDLIAVNNFLKSK